MARLKKGQVSGPVVREFTPAEVAEIRRLISSCPVQRHGAPQIERLERMQRAVGRQRTFKLWELDPVTTDAELERAVAEEIGNRKW